MISTVFASGVASASTSGLTFTFTESGLPAGHSWSVTINSSTYHQSYTTTSTQIAFSNVPSYVEWDVNSSYMTSVTSSAAYATYGSNQNIQVNFSPTDYVLEFTNSVDSSQSAQWSVTLTGTEINGNSYSRTDTQYTSSCTFTIPSGSYQWSASNMYFQPNGGSGIITSGQVEYVPQQSSGSFSGSVPSLIALVYDEYSFESDFFANGLPSGSQYTVNLNSQVITASPSQQIDFYISPGPYTYSYSTNAQGYEATQGGSPPSGTFTATAGGFNSFTAVFSDYYNLYFNETGLPAGKTWLLNLTEGSNNLGSFVQSSSNPPPISLAYGTYNYVIPPVGAYKAFPSSGTISMASTVSRTVIFEEQQPENYTVTFTPENLSTAQPYWVSIEGQNLSGTGPVTFQLLNGTYNYTAGSSGYENIRGTFNVSGSSLSVPLKFVLAPPEYTITFSIEITTSDSISLAQDSILFDGMNVTSGETVSVPASTYDLAVDTITQGTFSSWTSTGNIYIGNSRLSPTTADIQSSGGITMYVAPPSSTTTTYTLSLNAETGGSISYSYGSTTGTVASGQSLKISVPSGTSITLTAVPQSPSTFTGWTGTFSSSSTSLLIGIYENTDETATFTTANIPVIFQESGLASGTEWSATLGGETNTSTSGQLWFKVSPGTYGYSIPGVGADTVSPSSGSVTVSREQVIPVYFIPPSSFLVSFHETGLSPGTQWWVDINGQQLAGTGSTLQVVLPGNTYQYSPGYSGNLEPRNLTSTFTLNSNTVIQVPFYYVFSLNAQNGTETGVTISYYVNQTAYNSITGYSGTMKYADYLAQYLSGVPGFKLYGAKVTVNGNSPSLASQEDLLFRSLLWARATIEKPATLAFSNNMMTQIYTNYLSSDYVQKIGIALADAVNFLSSSAISDLMASIYAPSDVLALSTMFSLVLEILTSPSLLQQSSPTEYGGVLGVLSDFGLIPPKAQTYDPTTLMSEISSGNLPSNQFGQLVTSLYAQTSAAEQQDSMSSFAKSTISGLLLHFLGEDLSTAAAEKAMPMVTSLAAKVLTALGESVPAEGLSSTLADSMSAPVFLSSVLLFVAHLINDYSVMQANLLKQQINIASTLYYTILPDLYNSLLNIYSGGSSTSLPTAYLSRGLESTYMQMLSYSLLSTWYSLDYQILNNQANTRQSTLQSDQTMQQGTATDALEIYQLTQSLQSSVPDILNFVDPAYPVVQNLSWNLNLTSMTSGFPTQNVVAIQFNYSDVNQSYGITVGSSQISVNTYSDRNSTIQGNYPYTMFLTNSENRTVLMLFSSSSMNISVSGTNTSLAEVYSIGNNSSTARMGFKSYMGHLQYFSSRLNSTDNQTISTYSSSLTINPDGIGHNELWGVRINGITVNSTGNIVINGLPPGSYNIAYSNGTDYYTSGKPFNIQFSGGNITESVSYQHYSYITGTVLPADAVIKLNGQVVQTVNGSYSVKVPGGTYSLVASVNGYKTYYDNFTISSNVTKSMAISLQKEYGDREKLIVYAPFIAAVIVLVGLSAYLMRRKRR